MTIDATKWYALNLRDDIDFQRYTKLIQGLGRSLNERKNRFDKADIIEQSIETYSNGKLKWVDDIGEDFVDTESGAGVEFKFITNGMYTKKGNRKKYTSAIKLKNWNGNHKGRTLPKTAHYYMFGQDNALALIAYEDILPFCKYLDDGVVAQVPLDELEFIFTPSDIDEENEYVPVDDYLAKKRKMQREIIESIT